MNPHDQDAVFECILDDKAANFWVINAYNPDGRDANNEDNLTANAKLRAEIAEMGVTPFRIIGMSRDQNHAEPG
jgi:hypothetical protein